MPEKKAFLLRLDHAVFDAIQRWAADELRSANGQIEYLLRQSLEEARRLPPAGARTEPRSRRGG